MRETLVHEEFVAALTGPHEEKLGFSQADRDFGLPSEESWNGGWGSDGDWDASDG